MIESVMIAVCDECGGAYLQSNGKIKFFPNKETALTTCIYCAWANIKLRALLHTKIVEFYFKKTDGTLRQAFGTLKEGLIGEVKGTGRKPSDNVQVYWDTEKSEYRSFKKM